jgi:hypothetical protein
MTISQTMGRAHGIFSEVLDERKRQWKKWGDQHWPDRLPPVSVEAPEGDYTEEYWAFQRDRQRKKVDRGLTAGSTSWTAILLEELYEALAEESWPKKRQELVESAAVIAAWIADGDTRPEPGFTAWSEMRNDEQAE